MSKFKVGDICTSTLPKYPKVVKITRIEGVKVWFYDAEYMMENWWHESNLRKLTKLERALK